jgi:hypothetical protein
MKKTFLILWGVVSVLLACSCRTTQSQTDSPPVKGTESSKAVRGWEETVRSDLKETGSPSGIEIPLVICKNPGSGFSGISWRTGSRGQYEAYDAKDQRSAGGHKVRIEVKGSPQEAPVLLDAPSFYDPSPGGSVETPREWLSVYAPALGKNIRYYLLANAMGDTDDTWQTEIFPIEGKDGARGSYQVTIESTSEDTVPKLFSQLDVK